MGLVSVACAGGCISFEPIRQRNVASITDEMVELAGQSNDQTLVPPLIGLMQDRIELGAAGLPDDVAIQTAIALGRLGDPTAVNVLILALADAHGDVTYYAARSLGQLGDSKAEAPLMDLVLSGPDDLVRGQASRSLGELTGQDGLHVPGDVRASRANWQRWWAKQQKKATTRPTATTTQPARPKPSSLIR